MSQQMHTLLFSLLWLRVSNYKQLQLTLSVLSTILLSLKCLIINIIVVICPRCLSPAQEVLQEKKLLCNNTSTHSFEAVWILTTIYTKTDKEFDLCVAIIHNVLQFHLMETNHARNNGYEEEIEVKADFLTVSQKANG